MKLKVSGRTDPKSLAGNIVKQFTKEKEQAIICTAMGAGPINQASKGIAIAAHILRESYDIEIVQSIHFSQVIEDGKEFSFLNMMVFNRTCELPILEIYDEVHRRNKP